MMLADGVSAVNMKCQDTVCATLEITILLTPAMQ